VRQLKWRPISLIYNKPMGLHCSASLAVFGSDDVPPDAGSPEWILHLAKKPGSVRADGVISEAH
jgi:hypothetical protein